MLFVKKFEDLNKNDANIAGGKGASLGEMTVAGIPVPPGFVVLANAFEQFLKETDINIEIDSILHTVKHEEVHTIENASEKIQSLILGADMPVDIKDEVVRSFKNLDTQFVAVRSSATAEDGATAAWAGQLDTFLNTTEETLLKNVQKCWASLFTPRAIFYRFEKGLHKDHISVAVVVQKMVQSEVAGIAFSVHPVTEDRNQLIIEAGFGLGEAVVSGSVTPDSYVVEKDSGNIIDKNVSQQLKAIYRAESGGDVWADVPTIKQTEQKLNDEQIIKLGELVIKIEKHYGFPCDIEWAFENSSFYITQSRPITTLMNMDQVSQPKMTIEQESYDLHFRQSDFLFIFTDINFHPKNGSFDYVILQKGGEIACYLTKQGKQQARDLGVKWLDNDLSSEIINDLESFLGDLKDGKALGGLSKFEKDDYTNRWKIIESVANRFAYLYRYCENPVLEPVESVILKACSSQDDLLKVLKNPKYADELKFSQEIKNYLSRLIKAGELKFDLHIAVEPLWKEAIVFLKDLAEKFNYSFDQMSVLRADEISKFLGGGFLPSKEVLEERLRGLVLIPHGAEDGLLLVGSNYVEWKNKIERIEGADIKGTPAFNGKVRGKVKIHSSFLEGEIISPGTVVVAGMTNPQLVPFLKDAVAIVTDEGGLTCHAAIIARELKKPCIIGTKIATQILKDGDMVEVDADNGIVTIIK